MHHKYPVLTRKGALVRTTMHAQEFPRNKIKYEVTNKLCMASPHPNPTHSFRASAQTYTTVKMSKLLYLEFAGSMLILLYCYWHCINITATMCECCACKQCY